VAAADGRGAAGGVDRHSAFAAASRTALSHRQQKDPPRECAQCGQVKRHAGLGMCSACFQRRLDTGHGLALPTDHAEQLAAGRRQRRVDAVPVPPRPAVARFAGSMLAARERARRAGTRPRSDHTIETAGRSPASTAYVTHLVDACGVPPRSVRCTRLADLVNTIDPKLVAAALGMRPKGVMFYLADHVDAARTPAPGNTAAPGPRNAGTMRR
jgi:hypothetical protein